MAIEAAWDPTLGPEPLPPWDPEDLDEPGFEPLSDAEFEALFPWAPEPEAPFFEPDDPQDHALGADGPGWAVPGVTDTGSADDPEGGLSAPTLAALSEVDAAVEALRLAGARVYRALTALRASDVLAETRYQRLPRLLEDHVRLDPKTVAMLDRHAEMLHPHVTPTGATTPSQLPATALAVDDGAIDEHHVEIIAKTMDRLRKVPDLDETVLAVAEEQLAALASSHSPRALFTAAKVIADRLDPDGAAPKDDDPAGNELHLTKRRNGHVAAKLVLREPAAAALFADAIRAATPAPASAVTADPGTGLPPVSDDPDGRRVGADPRVEARDSKPSRQASGLLDLIAASHRAGLDHGEDEQHPGSPTASMPLPDLDDPGDTTAWPADPAATDDADPAATHDAEDDATDEEPPPHRPWTPPDPGSMTFAGRERVILTVTLDHETLRQQLTDTSQALALLGDSSWIRPGTARRLACDAEIIPVVLGSKGEVLDVGRRTRAIPTATGRAVTLRDRHCAFPGCRRRARTSEIHHISHWADLGETEPDNLVCLCRYHHDLVHHAGWDVAMIDHLPWFTPPAWLDPTRTPRHNRPWTLIPRT